MQARISRLLILVEKWGPLLIITGFPLGLMSWFCARGMRGVAQDIGMFVILAIAVILFCYFGEWARLLFRCVRWDVVGKRAWWYFCEGGVWFARAFLTVLIAALVGLPLVGAWCGGKGQAPSAQGQEVPRHGKRESIDADSSVAKPSQRDPLLRP